MVVLKLNLTSLQQQQQPQSPPTTSSLPRIRLKSSAAATPSTKIRIRNQKDVGLGYDSEASDREDDPAIEEQIILRCRNVDDAEYISKCIEEKQVPEVMIKFKGKYSTG